MKPIRLRTEYLIDPLGIDIPHPRLFWNCEGGQRQTAYRLIAKKNGKPFYDSEKVPSSSMHLDVPFALASRDRVAWQLILWDENDAEGEPSEEASFEMGLLEKSDWQAKWIAGDYNVSKKKRYPVDCFRKRFVLKDVKKARLYASACGLYELHLNGKRVGEFVLAPGSTDNRKRIQYQTYDVTSLLIDGENELTSLLADGWYRGSSGSKGRTYTYGKVTKLLAQLEIEHSDGEKEVICSDSSWSWSNDGPILFADLKDGEKVDARKAPSYSGKAKETAFEANLTSSNNVEVKERERFSPLKVITTPKGKKVLEFPQNISGYIAFSLEAHAGQRIHVKLGEMLGQDGELTLKNVQCTFKGKQSPLQEIDYVCKEGRNEYAPKFFYGGFRYAEIQTDAPFEMGDFAAIAVYSAFEETSHFECSNPLINKFYQNTLWSLKSNSTDLPSDCPTRERMGWTGDSEIFFNTASFMVDYASFARKHVRDIYDRQWNSGRLPQIAPYAHEDWFMWTMNGSVGWACAGVYIPLYFYQKYGDERILESYYQGMLKYANFMIKRAGKWGGVYAKPMHLSRKNRKYAVNCGQSYGEWCEPNDVCAFVWYDFASPHPEESTAYTYFTLKRVLEVARILGKPSSKELGRIKEYSEGARRAYQELVTKPKHLLDTDRQAKLVRPLYMGLLTPEQEAYAKKRLIKAMENYGWRLGTGFLSTPLILDVLSSIDVESAYRLLENEEMPGWLFMPKNGATTIWESWEGETTPDIGVASLNHYSKGALCQWLLEGMCGLKVIGENEFSFSPLIGGKETYASCSYQSVYGKVSAGWRKEGDKTVYEIELPPNTSGTLTFSGKTQKVGPGKHAFSC